MSSPACHSAPRHPESSGRRDTTQFGGILEYVEGKDAKSCVGERVFTSLAIYCRMLEASGNAGVLVPLELDALSTRRSGGYNPRKLASTSSGHNSQWPTNRPRPSAPPFRKVTRRPLPSSSSKRPSAPPTTPSHTL